MAWFVLSLVFFAVAILTLKLGKVQTTFQKTASVLADSSIASLNELCASIASELGPGSFRQFVRIKGKVDCRTPLTSELSQTSCVWYKLSVTRESARWPGLNRERLVSRHEMATPFVLEEPSGRLAVDPTGARFDGTLTSRYQREGSVVYHVEEECLPLGVLATVVGEAGDGPGSLTVRRPENRSLPFFVGPQATEKALQKAEKVDRFFSVTAAILTVAGVLGLIMGVLR